MEGKHQLELNWPGDGRLFLNFWDWAHGNDVIAEVVDGDLIIGDDEDPTLISFKEFVNRVKASIESRTIK